MGQPFPGGYPPPPVATPPKSKVPGWAIAVIVAGTLVVLTCLGGATALLVRGIGSDDGARSTPPFAAPATPAPRTEATASPVPLVPDGPPPSDKTYEGRGNKTVKISLNEDYLHIAKVTHDGASNVMVETVDDGGDSSNLVVNEVGDYDGLRPLDFDREQPTGLKIRADGRWKVTVMVADKAPRWTGKASGKAGAAVLRVDPKAADQDVRFTHKGRSNCTLIVRADRGYDLLVNDIGRYNGDMIVPTGTHFIEIESSGTWSLTAL
jgi:hypothetical protein